MAIDRAAVATRVVVAIPVDRDGVATGVGIASYRTVDMVDQRAGRLWHENLKSPEGVAEIAQTKFCSGRDGHVIGERRLAGRRHEVAIGRQDR